MVSSGSGASSDSERMIEPYSSTPVYTPEVDNSDPNTSTFDNSSDDSSREEVVATPLHSTSRIKSMLPSSHLYDHEINVGSVTTFAYLKQKGAASLKRPFVI